MKRVLTCLSLSALSSGLNSGRSISSGKYRSLQWILNWYSGNRYKNIVGSSYNRYVLINVNLIEGRIETFPVFITGFYCVIPVRIIEVLL